MFWNHIIIGNFKNRGLFRALSDTRILTLALCSLLNPYTGLFIISLSSCILRSVRAMVSAHSFSPSEIF